MEHPLIGDISQMKIEEITDRINELHRKLTIAQRSGNGHLANQIRMALETFQNQYQAKLREQNGSAGTDYSDRITIE